MKRDRQILDAAAELFYQRGFAGVGVDQIGARAGVSGPAIYHHFSGKDEILARLFTEGLDELLAVARSAGEGPDPAADLADMVRSHVAFVLDRRRLVQLFQTDARSLTGGARRTVRRRMREYASCWEEVLARCYPEAGAVEVRCGAQAAIGLIHSLPSWPPELLQADGIVELLCRLPLQGTSALGLPVPAPTGARP